MEKRHPEINGYHREIERLELTLNERDGVQESIIAKEKTADHKEHRDMPDIDKLMEIGDEGRRCKRRADMSDDYGNNGEGLGYVNIRFSSLHDTKS